MIVYGFSQFPARTIALRVACLPIPRPIIVGMGPTMVPCRTNKTGYKCGLCRLPIFIVIVVMFVIIPKVAVIIIHVIVRPCTGARNTITIGTNTSMEKKRGFGAGLFGKIQDGIEQQGARRNRRGHSNNAGAHQQLLRLPRWRTTTRRIHRDPRWNYALLVVNLNLQRESLKKKTL